MPALIDLMARHPTVLVTTEHTHRPNLDGTCRSCPGRPYPCVQVRCAREARRMLGWDCETGPKRQTRMGQ